MLGSVTHGDEHRRHPQEGGGHAERPAPRPVDLAGERADQNRATDAQVAPVDGVSLPRGLAAPAATARRPAPGRASGSARQTGGPPCAGRARPGRPRRRPSACPAAGGQLLQPAPLTTVFGDERVQVQ